MQYVFNINFVGVFHQHFSLCIQVSTSDVLQSPGVASPGLVCITFHPGTPPGRAGYPSSPDRPQHPEGNQAEHRTAFTAGCPSPLHCWVRCSVMLFILYSVLQKGFRFFSSELLSATQKLKYSIFSCFKEYILIQNKVIPK